MVSDTTYQDTGRSWTCKFNALGVANVQDAGGDGTLELPRPSAPNSAGKFRYSGQVLDKDGNVVPWPNVTPDYIWCGAAEIYIRIEDDEDTILPGETEPENSSGIDDETCTPTVLNITKKVGTGAEQGPLTYTATANNDATHLTQYVDITFPDAENMFAIEQEYWIYLRPIDADNPIADFAGNALTTDTGSVNWALHFKIVFDTAGYMEVENLE